MDKKQIGVGVALVTIAAATGNLAIAIALGLIAELVTAKDGARRSGPEL